jgi:hypothetical protein
MIILRPRSRDEIITPERPIVIDKPRSAPVTLAEFTRLQLLSTINDHPPPLFRRKQKKCCNAGGSGDLESADWLIPLTDLPKRVFGASFDLQERLANLDPGKIPSCRRVGRQR